MKPALLGFLAGALAAALLFRTVRPGAGNREAPPAATTPSPAAAAAETGNELAEVERQIEATRAEIASLRVSSGTPGDSPGPTVDAQRNGLAALLVGFLDGENWSLDLGRTKDQDASFRLLELMRRIAGELGVGIEELRSHPEGRVAVFRAMLDQLRPPLDRAAREAVEDVLRKHRAEWGEFAETREALTRLERVEDVDRIAEDLDTALTDTLDGAALSAWDMLDSLWSQTQPIWVGESPLWATREPAELVPAWTKEWAESLGLDDRQRLLLGPIVAGYLRDLEKGKAEKSLDKMALMIQAQKKIAATLDLNAEQAKALADWPHVYDYHVIQK